ncbi:hypothetical protein [Castellaniella sp.]|uniref:hypothetical protein n=1 Tax=Castellaniella sp. TaxID=1955812 RepID=UPI002AFE0B66|nr:hypothetical protein [Castellaniella sp.]
MIPSLLSIKTVALVGLTALVVGFSAGYVTKGRFESAERTSALSDARQGDVKIVASAIQREQRIADAMRGNDTFFALQDEALASLPSFVEVPHESAKVVCPRDPVLDDSLVGVLNTRPD